MSSDPLYYDCDTGVDDAMALAYILTRRDVRLAGIGTVSGNVASSQAAANTLAILQLAGHLEVDVAVGAADPLAGSYTSSVSHIHGRDGIGDIGLTPASRSPLGKTAAELLVDLARANPGSLRILTTGPLTNIAQALRLEPELPSLVKDITIMGGAAHVSGNVSPAAEANIGNDPEAAAVVMAARWNITLVPLDVTMAHTFEEADQRRLRESRHPVSRALADMLDIYFDFHRTVYGRRCCALHDPLAAAIALGGIAPGIAPVVNVVVDNTHGPGRGQTLCDLRGLYVGYPPQDGAHCRVVLSTEPNTAQHILEALLTL